MNAVMTPWRDEAVLAAVALGAVAVMHLPAIWLVVGRFSLDLLAFFVLFLRDFGVIAVAQVLALRWAAPRLNSRLLQFGVAALVGPLAAMVAGNRIEDAHARRLGLLAEDSDPGLLFVWISNMQAVFVVWYRAARERQAASARRLQRVQQAQLAARRALVDAQLREMQARVDPGQFFAALEAIEQRYAVDPAQAEALFDALVRFLRAAIPSVGEEGASSSTLGAELALAAACVDLHRLGSGEPSTLAIDAADTLRSRPFPPGVLLPLVAGALPARAIGITVQGGLAGQLALTFDASSALPPARLQQARDSLQALYGSAAALHELPSAQRLRIDIPAGGHRHAG